MIFATANKNKFEEIRAIMPDNLQLKSLADLNFTDEIPETENTLQGNALLKARYVYNRYKEPCFSDDSGLEVDALNGAPGVISSHYAGIDGTSEERANANTARLLDELAGKTDKTARFRTVIAYIDANGVEHLFEGTVEGQIIETPTGTQGFGYDPVFVPQGYNTTFAEMTMSAKNQISHRARAFKKFIEYLINKK